MRSDWVRILRESRAPRRGYDVGMDKNELIERCIGELKELTESGAVLPLHFRPHEAFMLMSVLQLALRHPRIGERGGVGAFAKDLALNIESRLCKSPAMAELARRGWNPEYDVQEEEKEPA